MEFAKRNRNGILRITLIVLYVVFIVFSWGKWGHVISDSFREAIIPEAMLDGKVLYRDILNLYPPLAYQVNAVLFKVFGCNLNVLYVVGIICGATVLSFLYKVVKEYSSEVTAFVTTLTVMELFTFRICVKNSAAWFFPYSYSFLYAFAFSFVAISLYLLMKRDRENRFVKMIIISILIGISLASKWDFLMLCMIPIYESVKNKSIKEFFAYVGLMILPSLLSFGIYMISGGTILDLLNQIQFLINFSHAPSVIAFNLENLPQSLNSLILTQIGISFALFAFEIFALFLAFSLGLGFIEKNKNIFKNLVFIVLLTVFSAFVVYNFADFQMKTIEIWANFVFVPYVLAIWAVAVIALKLIKKRDFSEKEKFCLSLVVIGFLFTFRQFAEVLNCYIGNFTIIPYWTAFVYLLIEILPSYIEKSKLHIFKKSLISALIIFGLTFTYIFLGVYCQKINNKISNNKGTFYIGLTFSKPINSAFDFINSEISSDKSILVVDEGLIFNWFSSRKTDLKFYSLIPHMVESIGEDTIVHKLSENLPDYVFLTNNEYNSVGFWGEDYAVKIKNLILNNYDLVKIIEPDEISSDAESICTTKPPIFLPEMNNPISISIFKKKE